MGELTRRCQVTDCVYEITNDGPGAHRPTHELGPLGYDVEWCSWFMGFFEGEGALCISNNGSPDTAIDLRYDDKPILEEIQDTIGGTLSEKRGAKHNVIRWRLTARHLTNFIKVIELGDQGSFEAWLAGFMDAEGYFKIGLDGTPQAAIKLRKDDQEILEKIKDRLGGSCRFVSRNIDRKAGAKRADQYEWYSTATSRHTVIEALESHMRAKKAKDFKIWKEAVLASAALNNGKPCKERKPMMLEYKKKLEAVRREGLK